jgi:hypothetical protein
MADFTLSSFGYFTAEARRALRKEVLIRNHSELCALSVSAVDDSFLEMHSDYSPLRSQRSHRKKF